VLSSGTMRDDETLDAAGTSRFLSGLTAARTTGTPLLLAADIGTADQRRLAAPAGDSLVLGSLGRVASTWDEAVATLSRVRPRSHIMVVTSPSHTRRGCATFERLGFRVTCVAAGDRDYDRWRPVGPEDRIAAFRSYFYERLAWLDYRRRGRVSMPAHHP
jgi:uncharacterized SAM-binding protein YcdF (DUF218 family)